jgi:flagellar biosynthetic protein FliS
MVDGTLSTAQVTPPAATIWSLEQKGQLLLRLYERAIFSMDDAIELIESGEMEAKGDRLIHAQDIVLQLLDALDARSGGPAGEAIATNLQRLYLYVYRRLILGNNTLDTKAIAEARRLMAGLYAAWRQALSPASAGAQRPFRARL